MPKERLAGDFATKLRIVLRNGCHVAFAGIMTYYDIIYCHLRLSHVLFTVM